MKIECPQCRQRIEVDESWAGLEVRCPSCNGRLIVPSPAPLPADKASASRNAHLVAWRRKQRIVRGAQWLAVLVLAAAGLYWFTQWKGDRSAAQGLRDLTRSAVERVQRLFAAPPARPRSTPARPSPRPSTPMPAPEPAETPVPESTPEPLVAEPSPSPEPSTPTPTPLLPPPAAPSRGAALGALLLRDAQGRPAGVKFRVWAPNAKAVAVTGSFDNWRERTNPMTKDAASGVWEATVRAAKPGDEYAFIVDGIRKRDPRARAISAKSRSIIYDTSAFDWGNGKAPKASLEDTVIYQLHPGVYFDPDSEDGLPATLRDAASKLDHIKALGANTILLLPVNEFPAEHSWGYNPTDLFAIERGYGGPDALKEFVKAAHERGLAVHVDVVHNHYGPDDLDLYAFDGEGAGETKAGIYFYGPRDRSQSPWGPRPDFGKREVRNFIEDQIRMWFDEYKIDGLRWDSTANIRRYDDGTKEDTEGQQLLEEVSRMIRKEYPGKLSIAEDAVGDDRFDASWQYDFHHAGADRELGVVPQLAKKPDEISVEDLAARVDSPLGFRRVIYTENHDEAGVLNGNRRLLASADSHNPQSLEARRKAALGAVLTLTSPGIPMIFMGQELSEDESFHDNKPLNWERKPAAGNATALYRDLIALRRNFGGQSAGLLAPNTRVTETDAARKILAYSRTHPGHPEGDVFVVINFSDQPVDKLPLNFPKAGKWQLLLNTDDPRYGEGFTGIRTKEPNSEMARTIEVSLAPYSAQIFGRPR